jgi:hypothetical protein
MTEKQLISKIKKLEQIKPRQDWVFLTKERLLEQEKAPVFSFNEIVIGLRFVLGHKLAFSSLAVLIVLIGVFGFSQQSVPGDALFTIKKATEKGLAVFIAEDGQSKRKLELANKRLDDLTKIAQNNTVNNLSPAINEYKEMISEAAESLVNKELGQGIVLEVKKLEENKQRVEALGVVIDNGQELDNVLSQLIQREIKDLDDSILNEEEEKVLEQIKQDFENREFLQALERILMLNQ